MAHARLSPAELVRSLSPTRMHLVLFATEACNCRCTYCYQDFQLGRMRPAVVRGLKRLLASRADGLEQLEISWFGGEPLLARDVIEEVMTHVHELAATRPLQVSASITTNALPMTRPVLARLLQLGVRTYQIALDGVAEDHDRRRVLAGGKGGTFARIWENITAMREREEPFFVTLDVHVDEANLAGIPALLDDCHEAFGGDPRFQVDVRQISRYGGPNDDELPVIHGSDPRLIALQERARELGLVRPPGEGDGQYAHVCYASTATSFVVRADGRLNKCSIALSHPANQVGQLREDGTVAIESPRMHAWTRGLTSGHAPALACPLIGILDPGKALSAAV